MQHKNPRALLVFIYVALAVWWFTIYFRGLQETTENYLFSLIYSIMPLGWGLLGFVYARRWGGFASQMGRAVAFLSIGLFAWGIGNVIYGYYNLVLHVPVPYPSLADLGFSLLYPFSALGVASLFGVTGARFALRHTSGKAGLLLIPLFFVGLSYYLLFIVARGGVITYEGDMLKLFLDVAYPVGDLVVITLAAVVYALSYYYLGGMFRKPVVIILVAFTLSYITDFAFAYTTTTGTFFVGNWVELLFATTFFLISYGLTCLNPHIVTRHPQEI